MRSFSLFAEFACSSRICHVAVEVVIFSIWALISCPFDCSSCAGVFDFPGSFGCGISVSWSLSCAEDDVCIAAGPKVVNHRGCPLEVVGGGELGNFPAVFGVEFVRHVWRIFVRYCFNRGLLKEIREIEETVERVFLFGSFICVDRAHTPASFVGFKTACFYSTVLFTRLLCFVQVAEARGGPRRSEAIRGSDVPTLLLLHFHAPSLPSHPDASRWSGRGAGANDSTS